MANSDDFTLDDHFVSSAANKISAAQLEERERQKAIKGIGYRVPASTIYHELLAEDRVWRAVQCSVRGTSFWMP